MSPSLKVSYKVSITIHYLNVKVNLKRNWRLFSANTNIRESLLYQSSMSFSFSFTLTCESSDKGINFESDVGVPGL